jgi:hypothetical protein
MRFIVILILLVASADCIPRQGAGTAADAQAEPTDAELQQNYGNDIATQVSALRAKRKAALAAPGDMAAATAYGDALIDGLQGNFNQINRIDWAQYAKDAAQVLQVAAQAPNAAPEAAADALVKRGSFLGAINDAAGAKQSVKDGFAKAHTYLSGLGMVGVYRVEKKPADAQALCEKTRPMAKSEDDVYKLISECLAAVESKDTAEQALPWVVADDWTMYKRRAQEEAAQNLARRQAEEAADAERRQQQEERRQAEAQSPATGLSGNQDKAAGSSGPQRVSFTMRNTCRETVKLFYGETPKFGGGHTDTMSGNSSHGEAQNAGTMIWITDASGNGIASYSVSPGIHELEIGPSCTSFMAH